MKGQREQPELRPSSQLRGPMGLFTSLQLDQPRILANLKRKRGGRKGAITRRIKEINEMIQARGSRTKLKFLRDGLEEVWKEALNSHEELMLMLEETDPDFNDEWIEEVGSNVNTCLCNIHDYLKERINDTPSVLSDDASLCGSYIQSIPVEPMNQSPQINIAKWNEYNLDDEFQRMQVSENVEDKLDINLKQPLSLPFVDYDIQHTGKENIIPTSGRLNTNPYIMSCQPHISTSHQITNSEQNRKSLSQDLDQAKLYPNYSEKILVPSADLNLSNTQLPSSTFYANSSAAKTYVTSSFDNPISSRKPFGCVDKAINLDGQNRNVFKQPVKSDTAFPVLPGRKELKEATAVEK